MTGQLENFNVKCFLDAAHELVRADEITRALKLLNNLPAFYRDYPPKEVTDLKNLIIKRTATPNFYAKWEATIDFDLDISYMKETLRGSLLIEEVKRFNEQGISPHIVDYGPGEFWAPRMLFDEGLFHTYKPITICSKASQLFDEHFPHFRGEPDPKDPVIFLGLEIIEHLWNEDELKTTMLANCGLADVVHISTPRYTYDGRDQLHNGEKVRDCLGHLRAYTPNEFVHILRTLFVEYDWQYFDGPVMHMRLTKKI